MKTLGYFSLSLLLLLGNSSGNSAPQDSGKNRQGSSGTVEKMIASTGNVAMDLDVTQLKGTRPGAQETNLDTLRFEVSPNSFFTIRVIDGSLRGPDPSSMSLISRNSAALPEPLNTSLSQLAIEQMPSGGSFDLVVRDGKTGFVFFNVEGQTYEYDAAAHLLSINGGRLLVSEELAKTLGRPSEAGLNVGQISVSATMYPIEVTTFVNGAATSITLPPRKGGSPDSPEGSVPGPDIVVGDMSGLQQFGSASGQVGLATGATSCNNGNVPVHFYRLPDPDHSVVSQNLYRMSGGPTNNDRFEQLGQSWSKHTFGADQEDACGFGCTPFPDQSELGVGCSDPYLASQNGFQGNTNSGALGSRAWINAFTGAFSVNPRPDNHTGHTHTGTSHRLLVNTADLNTTLNAGATYYLEVQYDSPHEYAWCTAHPGECNMYNNASYRRYNVSGTTSFTFTSVGATVRMTPATGAWTGATSSTIEPEPGVDGRAFVVYKVTGPVAGLWHYEYAIHNQNLDRSIQSFSVPLGCGITVSNTGFHAPPNHPGFPNDGTVGSAGFSNAAWTPNQVLDSLTWNTETFAQNPNANAIRFGTMYNFRFDSDRPPQAAMATVGFFKTGAPITVAIQAPAPDVCTGATPTPFPTVTPTATPVASATPSATPTPTPVPSATPSPTASPIASPTATPAAQAVNLSTRMRVGTDENVGIGGFIITAVTPGAAINIQPDGSTPAKHVIIRAIGPSLAPSVPDAMADPVLELHGPNGFVTVINNNWRDDPAQEALIIASGIPPTNDLESAIDATLAPGAYTAIVRGNNNTSGVALVEVYDLSEAVLAKLANISTRAFVGTADNIVIAGFMLGNNNGDDRVVVRGIAAPGVPNPLLDPTLELRNADGALIGSDNDWQDDAAQAAAISELGLAPPGTLDAAIVVTVPPGIYTALLAGRNGTTGVGLVEVYDVGTP